MIGNSDQYVSARTVTVDEAHCRDEVQGASSARKSFGPQGDALNRIDPL